MEHKVTVVIPVYSDWQSLSLCIGSLKKYLGTQHKVLLVNDCGPEADQLERKIKDAIKDHPNFEYHRNPKNLGFVGTCNRTVFELDKTSNDILLLNSDTAVTTGFLGEMLAVLYAKNKHGTVSPRSNSATHANIPLCPRDGVAPSPKGSYEIFKKIRGLLPRFTVSVDAPGFCLLTKRELIKQFGLFDEIYSPGYAEETDYCMRLRKQGHLSLFANHAFVFHYRAETFTSERKQELKNRNKKILFERYPDVENLVRQYLDNIDPVDWFADIIVGPRKPTKILIDLSTTKHDQEIDELLIAANALSTREDVDVAVTDRSNDYSIYPRLRVINREKPNELFHLGYRIGSVDNSEIDSLNKWCLRVINRIPDDQPEQLIRSLLIEARKLVQIEDLRRRRHYSADAVNKLQSHNSRVPKNKTWRSLAKRLIR